MDNNIERTHTHTLSSLPWLLLVENQMRDIPYCVLTHITPSSHPARLDNYEDLNSFIASVTPSSHCPRAGTQPTVNSVTAC